MFSYIYKINTKQLATIILCLLSSAAFCFAQQTNNIDQNKDFTNFDSFQFSHLLQPREFQPVIEMNSNSEKILDTIITYNYYDTSKFIYNYNRNGKILTELLLKKEGQNWENLVLKEIVYNENDKIKISKIFNYENNSWQLQTNIELEYNQNGDTLTFLRQSFSNGNLFSGDLEEYTYNEFNNVDSIIKVHTYSSGEKYIYSIKNLYDSDQNKIEEIYKYLDDGNWTYQSKNVFSYNKNGRMLTSEYFTWFESEWELYSKLAHTYDDSDLIIKSEIIENYGQDYELKWQYFFEYNDQQTLISQKGEKWVEEDWEFWNQSYWIYDEGYLMEYVFDGYYMWGMGHIHYRFLKEEYFYNDFNKVDVFLRTIKNEDNITYKYRSLYLYDEEGDMISASSQREEQNQWVDEFAEFNYDYNGLHYRIFGTKAIFRYSIITDIKYPKVIPSFLHLAQNYPNPFNPETTIKYSIPANAKGELTNVVLKIYDLLGREITTLVNEEHSAGNYQVEFNAANLSSGVYIYRLTSGELVLSKKMMFLK